MRALTVVLAAVVVQVVGAGCAVRPYDPATRELRLPLPKDAFTRIEDVVRAHYPRLVVVDAEALRLQSDWQDFIERGRVARRRLTLWVEAPGVACAVVEASYLVGDLLGRPEWSSVRAHPALEREILDAVEAGMGG